MRITRRTAAASAAAATMAVTLAACSGGGGGGSSDGEDLADRMVGAMEDYDVGTTFRATEPVTFSLLYRDHPNYPLDEDWLFFQELEENQNVTFDLVNVPLSDWEQRRSLLIGAGDAPEIIPVTYPGQETPFVAGGAILPVSDYLDHLPNFVDKVERWGLQDEIDNLRQEDGKFYLLPGLHEQPKPQYSFAIRKDLFEAAGITEEPATFDELAEQLEAVLAANPELDHAYTDRWSLNGPIEATMNLAAPNFCTAAGWGYGQGVWFDEDTGEYVYTGATESYRQLVEYFAGLVESGVMDPESVSQDDDTAIAKFTSGRAAVIGSNDQEILRYRDAMAEAGVEGEIVQITVPAGPCGDYIASGGRLESGLMVSSEAAEQDHFVALLQLVDWLYYSDEGLEFAKWGVEGVTYEKAEDGTRTLAEDVDINGLNPGAPEVLNTDYGFHNGVFMPAHGSTADLDTSMLRPEVKDFVEAMNERKEELPLPPPIRMGEAEREQASLLQTALHDHVMQNTSQFILGQRSLDEWDAYVSELQGIGMDQYVSLINEAAARD